MNRKRLLVTTAGAALAMALVACGSTNSNGNPNNTAARAPSAVATSGSLSTATTAGATAAAATKAAGTPTQAAQAIRRGGTLSLAYAADAKTFDPMVQSDSYSGYVTAQIYDGLVMYDKDIKPVGNLADSWEISPDGLSYTFHLHKGVKFHDGTDFNAAAMKFSMERIRGNKASVGYQDCGPDAVADTQAPDDLTFKVVLTKPYAPFLTKLTGRCGAAVSPTAVQKLGDEKFGLNPVGTGPFKFGEWQQGDHMTVVKFDGYWKQGADGNSLPYLDKVTWRLIQDDSQRLQGLLTGEIDIGQNVADKDIDTVKATPSLVFQQTPGTGWVGFMLNLAKPPFNNKPLAQAVAFAINRDEIISGVYKNLRDKQEGGVIPPPLSWAIDPSYKPYTYDPAKAKALLSQAGMANGFTFTILVDAASQQTQDVMQLVQSQLKAVGITMNIETGDFNNVLVKRGLAGDFEADALTLSGALDPDDYTYGTFHTGAQFNIPKLSDPKLDALMEQGRVESDLAKRAEIYKQVNKLIMDASPWIMIANSPSRFVGNKKVQGWHVGTWATVGYSEYWKSAE